MYRIGAAEKMYDDKEGLSIIGIDEENDLCMIENKNHRLKPLRIVAPEHKVKIRDEAFVVGAPSGVFPIETHGFVSMPEFGNENRLLVSVSIFSGNSGSPLMNKDGEVIGVVVAGVKRYPNVCFATSHRALIEFIKVTLEQNGQ